MTTLPGEAVKAMPERIYAKVHGASTDLISGQRGLIGGWNEHKRDGQAEYVRADLAILSALEPSAARELALEEGDLQELLERLDAGLEYEGWMETDGAPVELFDIGAAQDLFADAAAAIRALSFTDHADAGKVEGDGWLPIESAPKDGTVIDLWSDEYGRLTDCYWGAPMAYEGGETGWVHAHSNEWAESPDEFVHWRPLPLPPVKGGQNG